MKLFFKEYSSSILVFIITPLFFILLSQVVNTVSKRIENPDELTLVDIEWIKKREKPLLQVQSALVAKGSEFDYRKYIIHASSQEGEDLMNEVYTLDEVNTSIIGGHTITYIVSDKFGIETRVQVSFIVE